MVCQECKYRDLSRKVPLQCVFDRQIIVGQNAIDSHIPILDRFFGVIRPEEVANDAVLMCQFDALSIHVRLEKLNLSRAKMTCRLIIFFLRVNDANAKPLPIFQIDKLLPLGETIILHPQTFESAPGDTEERKR